MSLYSSAPAIRLWLTPQSLHTRWRPFCDNLSCACHYEDWRMELVVRLVEHHKIGGDDAPRIYRGEAIRLRKAEVVEV